MQHAMQNRKPNSEPQFVMPAPEARSRTCQIRLRDEGSGPRDALRAAAGHRARPLVRIIVPVVLRQWHNFA